MNLAQALENENKMTLTENGAETFKKTGNYLLDLFALGGAVRQRTEEQIIRMFRKALAEDATYALKCLFYFRDIRGGLGERNSFRIIIRNLAKNNTESVIKNLKFIPEMGRWDDLLEFIGTPVETAAFQMMKDQLNTDILAQREGKPISLLAKWLPSINTSSKETCAQARKFVTFLGCTPKKYRKALSTLRSYSNVIEVAMSANQWDSINYEAVPSNASKLYRKAFFKHSEDKYTAYLAAVEKGEAKINASTLYPYDIARVILMKGDDTIDRTLEAQWKALPNYIPEDGGNSLVLADVSGSMFTSDMLPISTSVGLAMYFAERNTGLFKDYFMTFSGSPQFVKIHGTTLADRLRNITKTSWAMNTDLQKAFTAILNAAIKNHVPEVEMPHRLFIISDMEFDACVDNGTNFQNIERKYKEVGYELPQVVFWNVNARNDHAPVEFDQKGVMLVSGQSPTIFKAVMESKVLTPYDLMMEVLNKPRYAEIVA